MLEHGRAGRARRAAAPAGARSVESVAAGAGQDRSHLVRGSASELAPASAAPTSGSSIPRARRFCPPARRRWRRASARWRRCLSRRPYARSAASGHSRAPMARRCSPSSPRRSMTAMTARCSSALPAHSDLAVSPTQDVSTMFELIKRRLSLKVSIILAMITIPPMIAAAYLITAREARQPRAADDQQRQGGRDDRRRDVRHRARGRRSTAAP